MRTLTKETRDLLTPSMALKLLKTLKDFMIIQTR